MSEPRVVGIDVSRDELVIAIEDAPTVQSVSNDAAGFQTLLAQLTQIELQVIVLEASGGYERGVQRVLWTHELPVYRANPRQVREFARSSSRLAKTDAVDAWVLVHYGRAMRVSAQQPLSPARQRLAMLQTRRRAVLKQQLAEQNRAKQATDPFVRDSCARLLATLAAELDAVTAEIEALIAADAELAQHAQLLQSVPGVGPASIRLLLAELPELGRLSGKEVAALAGVAPFTQQSGRWRGRERIRAGRASLRHGLYMAAVAAITHNPVLRAFYARLDAAGKPGLVVMTAVIRKLLVMLNAMVRDGRPWQPPAWAST